MKNIGKLSLASNARAAKKLYQEALREMTTGSRDVAKARHSLQEASRLGSDDASYALATWYLFAVGVKRDYRKAVALLRRAAKGRVASAHFDLAVCYERGHGVRRNLRKAFDSYCIAAELGDHAALYEVGRCYFWGIGTKRNRSIGRALTSFESERKEKVGHDL
jgi:TPR repeat protein